MMDDRTIDMFGEELGIEVVYLPTVTNSSSKILKDWVNQSEKNVQ